MSSALHPTGRFGSLLLAGALLALASASFTLTRVSLAIFTDSDASTGHFTTGFWATPTTWYLHNNPTPPTGNTTAQFNLPLNATAPTATTLRNYDTNCDGRAGRVIQRGTGLVTEATTCRYANWRSAALASVRNLNGSGVLHVFARKTQNNGQNPTLRAFLRVFDPVSSTYTELGTANVTVTTNANAGWVDYALSWTLSGVVVPTGSLIEVKIVATGGNRNPEIAYDTTAYPSRLMLP